MTDGSFDVLKEQEVPGYDRSLYESRRIEATARDGKTKIPISLVGTTLSVCVCVSVCVVILPVCMYVLLSVCVYSTLISVFNSVSAIIGICMDGCVLHIDFPTVFNMIPTSSRG